MGTLTRREKTSQRLDMREDLAHLRSVNLKSSRCRCSPVCLPPRSRPSPLPYAAPPDTCARAFPPYSQD